jgi:hypothetical protein
MPDSTLLDGITNKQAKDTSVWSRRKTNPREA